jgi:hypothetical protein
VRDEGTADAPTVVEARQESRQEGMAEAIGQRWQPSDVGEVALDLALESLTPTDGKRS